MIFIITIYCIKICIKNKNKMNVVRQPKNKINRKRKGKKLKVKLNKIKQKTV